MVEGADVDETAEDGAEAELTSVDAELVMEEDVVVDAKYNL